MRLRQILELTAFVALATLAACKPTEKQNTEGVAPVEVGAIIPLTGEVATYGESLKRGFDLAAAQYPGKIKLLYEDSRADPKDGVTAMQKLLGGGTHYFLGDATSGVCLALAPLAEQNEAVLLISIATSDDITKAGPYAFRNCPPNRRQANAAAVFIKDRLNSTRVAVLSKANPYGANLASQFRKDAATHSLQIIFDEEYESSLKDFSTVIEKLKAAKPEAVFIPGNYEETALILRKAKELGFGKPFIGTDGAYSPKLMELAGPAAEGFYLTMLGVDRNSPFYRQFEASYREKYKSEPDVFSAYGYEGATILFKEIEDGASVGSVLSRLNKGSWPGLLGDVKFDADGEVLRSVSVFQVHGAQFVPYANEH